jgi:hypothetical protein
MLFVAVALPGCGTPTTRAVVDPAILGQASLSWSENVLAAQGSGGLFGGTRVAETDYYHQSQSPPPYSGLIQVFALQGDKRTTDQLLEAAHAAVANVTAQRGIERDATEATGERDWRDGTHTHYFVIEGVVADASGELLFPQDAHVRILGEAGEDPSSGAHIVVIAIAQTAQQTQCPIVGPCGVTTTDLRTWNEITGDPNGSIGGARSDVGLVYHLVTQ